MVLGLFIQPQRLNSPVLRGFSRWSAGMMGYAPLFARKLSQEFVGHLARCRNTVFPLAPWPVGSGRFPTESDSNARVSPSGGVASAVVGRTVAE